MKLIFIVGKKRSGKDTAVSFIKDNFKTQEYKLASPIKEALYHSYISSGMDSITNQKLSIFDWDGEGVDREKSLPMNNYDVTRIMQNSLHYLNQNYKSVYGFDPYSFYGVIDKVVLNNTEAWSIRRLMQTLGTDIVVDYVDKSYWMRLFNAQYKPSPDTDFYIVPDTRQEHELSYARQLGATVIHVKRDSQEIADSHITEAGLNVQLDDIVIDNNSTLKDFKLQINKVMKTL